MKLLQVIILLLATSAAAPTISGNCGGSPLVVSGSGYSAVIDFMDMKNNCEVDVQGPNDVAGQKDLNRYCARNSFNESSFFYWSWDDISWTGSNTGDACILLDANKNGAADYALCLSVHSDGEYMNHRFFRCTSDTAPNRCFGSEEILPPSDGFLSDCCVQSNSPTDPFIGLNRKTTGDHYPYDTLARCQVFLSDFQVDNLEFIDVCSYPSLQPNSDPSDCVLTKFCADNRGEPDDSLCNLPESKRNGCWESFCDPTLGTCRQRPVSVGTVCEDPNNPSFCDGKDVCDGSGNCVSGITVNCSTTNCGTVCQEPFCLEPTTFSSSDEATCSCGPNPSISDCTSECDGDEVCQNGLCQSDGSCSCTNLNKDCSDPRDGPCDSKCQKSACTLGKCLCNNLSNDILCESNPPNFCDGKSRCSDGSCVTSSPPTCDQSCETVCQKELCQNPSVFTVSTDATCVCGVNADKTGLSCEDDGISCTNDLCGLNGICNHTAGSCDGCASACMVGECIVDPTGVDLVWNDGCRYKFYKYYIPSPPLGTKDEFCVDPVGLENSILRLISGASVVGISTLSIGLFLIIV